MAPSAYPTEGACNPDGKGPPTWDPYAPTPGQIQSGDTGDVANDPSPRYTGDVRLMKDLGANAYRLSIPWPHTFPQGTGTPNPNGLDFSHRVADEPVAAGMTPLPHALPRGPA